MFVHNIDGSGYSVVDFREEVVRQLCGSAEYNRLLVYEAVQADSTSQFGTARRVTFKKTNIYRRVTNSFKSMPKIF